MIFGHEGGVRAGKSYEAVLYHILPALQARRHVFARLNGIGDAECMQATADYLGVPLAEIEPLVHPMGNAEVHEWLVCDTANDGSLTFPHIPKGSLIVVDEGHEYWPVGRANLPERTAQFFAKHGHISLDIVVLTQDVKELHRSVVRRMTKKNFYAKLDSLGDKHDNSYSVRFYSSPLPGKFELLISEKRSYDPKVWACYHGVQPGVEENAVYKGNTTNLWRAHRKKVFAMAALVLVGVASLANFFMGGIGIDAEKETPKPVAQATPAAGTVYQPDALPAPVQRVVQPVTEKVKEPEPVYPAGIAYVLDVAKKARPRYLGYLNGRDLVEFRKDGARQVIERLDIHQLRALGWTVERTPYGLRADFQDETLIFTAWPDDPLYTQSQAQAQAIRAAGPPVLSASETQPASAVAPSGTLTGSDTNAGSAAYGGFRGAVGEAPRFGGG